MKIHVLARRSLCPALLLFLTLGLLQTATCQSTAAVFTLDGTTAGRIFDMSGHGRHLVSGAAPGLDEHDPVSSSDVPFAGITGNHARFFDGENDFVQGPGFFQPDRAFGLELRFKRTSADLAHPQVLVSTRGFECGGFEVRLQLYGSIPRLVFEWWDQTGVSHVHDSGYVTLLHHWYKLTIIHDYNGYRTQTIMGLDGLAIGIHTVGGPRFLAMDPEAPVVLGSNIHGVAGGGTAPVEFEGGLDEIRFVYGPLALESILTQRFLSETAYVQCRSPLTPGASVRFDLASDMDAEAPFVLLPSLGLTAPGHLPAPDGRPLPVGLDALTVLAIHNLPPFTGSVGLLDVAGRGAATMQIPARPELSGLAIGVGFVVLDPGAPHGIRRVSIPASLLIGP